MSPRGVPADHPGVICTFSDHRSRYFPGKSGLGDAIAYADAHDLKVYVFSTPDTILRDLQGTRAREPSAVGAKHLRYGELLPYDSPEERMLRGRRRLDLFQRPAPRPRWWPLRIFRREGDT